MTTWTGGVVGSTRITSADGVPLRVSSAGTPGRPAVLIASACGMPADLCGPWMRFLADRHHVLTWETRGLSSGGHCTAEAAEAFDLMGHQVAHQVEDLLAVLDYFDVPQAHVMGLCGGAVVALRAAEARPGRVTSLSLWHGDYALGPESPTSDHQRNLQALLDIASENRKSAAMVRSALDQSKTAGLHPDIADLVLRPYRDDESMYRYAKLNGALMAEDIRDALPRIIAPTLVVTSADDETTHPAGSYAVAAALPRSVLHMEPHGDHLSVFEAGEALTRVAAGFLKEVGHC
ncbi:alpha/beta fold hydrolase [Streptomyces sp. NRRL S-1022]|uniref:alpha/beta fold hydrolase n=1 Tax=Streptomyces sp. NRRL S-1022 TaxID=1463880 RepID=UPI000689297E|nr:alpha/beta hydrolase [Streptomyces sp. NRRL S-1022]